MEERRKRERKEREKEKERGEEKGDEEGGGGGCIFDLAEQARSTEGGRKGAGEKVGWGSDGGGSEDLRGGRRAGGLDGRW
jgi:hypothetical protein